MRRKLPPFVECWRDRHGKLRVYFRRDRGRRIALPTTIASEEFNAAYQSALSGQLTSAADRHHRPRAGTIDALIASYMRSSAYLGLRGTTKDRVCLPHRGAPDEARPPNHGRADAPANRFRHTATLC
jgi:hypothetical protein